MLFWAKYNNFRIFPVIVCFLRLQNLSWTTPANNKSIIARFSEITIISNILFLSLTSNLKVTYHNSITFLRSQSKLIIPRFKWNFFSKTVYNIIVRWKLSNNFIIQQ